MLIYNTTYHVEDDQEAVSRQFEKYGLVEIPVVNDDNQLVGVITVLFPNDFVISFSIIFIFK